MNTRIVRRWVAWGLLAGAAASVGVWQQTRERLPETIHLATAARGGLYYEFGTLLGPELAQRTGVRVEVLETEGSVANRALLSSGEADLALIQLGTVDPEGLVALAPLYEDVVHVLVRADRGLETIEALDGRRILLGPADSGMRQTAQVILRHHAIEVSPEVAPLYFTALESDPTLDGAIVTSGFANPDLRRLLATGDFRLLELAQAEALATSHPLFTLRQIPMGLFRGRPAVPERPIATLAVANVLASRPDAPDTLVESALAALHESYLRPRVPGLIARDQAAVWDGFPLHPAARAYYDPYQSIGVLANLFETLAAIKELLFALGAALYLLFTYWKGLQRRELEAELSRQKERLDLFLERTVAIERAQVAVEDPAELRGFLARVTDIKLEALEELTGEEVRGDQVFSIFLTQCSSLSRKLEAKLQTASPRASPGASPRRSNEG